MSQSITKSELRNVGSAIITMRAGLAIVSPAHEELLRPVLCYQELGFRPDSNGRVIRVTVTKYVCERQGDDLIIPSGCVTRVRRHLTELGYDTQVEDSRDLAGGNCQIDERNVEQAEANFPGLADGLASHLEGVIQVSGSKSNSNLLGTVCQLFHSAKIFIACKTREATQEIAGELGPFLGGEVEAVHGWNWQSSCRVVCGTFGSLDRSDPADWQILIFADAFEGIQETNRFARADYRHRRLYALVDPRRRQTPRDELLFETLAGPVIYRDPRCRQRTATELLAAFATYVSAEKRLIESARDRHIDLWDDAPRNQAIADVALALSSSDEPALWKHGLFLQGDEGLSAFGPQPGVIVIVDSVEHGEQLRRSLPNWHFFHGRPEESTTPTSGMAALSWGIPRNSIVTVVTASTQLYFDCQIIIWAGAGSMPFIPTNIGRSTRPHLLIDFWDDGNCQLAADTQQRFNAFQSIGCRILGENLDQRQRALVQERESDQPDRQRNISRRHRRSHRPSV